jgi:ATP-dependent 26S proteasome regulatory subunit
MEERGEIFRIHLAKRDRDPRNFDIDRLVAASVDFSGAEIEEAIISALYDVFYLKQELATNPILATLGQTVPLAKTMAEKISSQRNWAVGRARNASVPHAVDSREPVREMEF